MNLFVENILALSRTAKQMIVLALDILLSAIAIWLSFVIRWESFSFDYNALIIPFLFSCALSIPIFVRMGLYRMVFRHANFAVITNIALAIAIYGLLFSIIIIWLRMPGVPRSIGVIQPILLLVFVVLSRMFLRLWLSRYLFSKEDSRRNAVIFGAGSCGTQLAASIEGSRELNLRAFVDDDPNLHGQNIYGKKVLSPGELSSYVKRNDVSVLLLAMPSAGRARRREIIAGLKDLQLQMYTVPGIADIASGAVTFSDIRELDITDLLGRSMVETDIANLAPEFADSNILITGAGGTIGGEISRQLLNLKPKKLLLFDVSEHALYNIHSELQQYIDNQHLSTGLMPLLGSVRDEVRLREIMNCWHPKWLFHAAAYKHVPLVEENICEGILNNSMGTLTSMRVALEAGVSNYILVSTDKAVRPGNVMGASKRLAEMILQAASQEDSIAFASDDQPIKNNTILSMVRFGNVLDSSGSVVPLFRQQIAAGGPVTVTDEEVTRYFMTISEAARLVINAGAMAKGGEVFLLDMGEPVRIYDMARRMISLSGLTVRDEKNRDGDIDISIIGLRSGEKLHEELLIGDSHMRTRHDLISCAHEEYIPWQQLQKHLWELEELANSGKLDKIKNVLSQIVPGFRSNSQTRDLKSHSK